MNATRPNRFLRDPSRIVTAADPHPDENGGCAQCGGPRPKPSKTIHGGESPFHKGKAERVKKPNSLAASLAADDPFCSAVCCRAWYGVPDPPPPEPRGRGPKRWNRKSPR